jgi:phage shock protein C
MKRLGKSNSDRRIAGVCGGIAEYLNIDPTIVRLIWGVLALVYGTGIGIYILCALIMPKSDRLY